MKVSMKVVLEDPEPRVFRLTADARDVRRYEGHFRQSFLTSELSMTQLTQLAWATMARRGLFKGSYEGFDEVCTEVEGDEGTEQIVPDPIQPDLLDVS